MDINEIKTFFAENADKEEVKNYLSELSQITPESKSGIIEEFKKSQDFTSEVDRAVSKAVLTHDEKVKPKLEKELRDKITKELNPEETPAQKENRELKERLDRIEKEGKAKDFKLKANSLINEKKLPAESLSLLQKMNFDDDDDLDNTVAEFNSIFESVTQKRLDEKLAGIGKPTPSGNSGSSGVTREMLKDMSPEEINKARQDGKLDSILAQ